jgi:hypothetical protein
MTVSVAWIALHSCLCEWVNANGPHRPGRETPVACRMCCQSARAWTKHFDSVMLTHIYNLRMSLGSDAVYIAVCIATPSRELQRRRGRPLTWHRSWLPQHDAMGAETAQMAHCNKGYGKAASAVSKGDEATCLHVLWNLSRWA